MQLMYNYDRLEKKIAVALPSAKAAANLFSLALPAA
jgi:hypothetical protein